MWYNKICRKRTKIDFDGQRNERLLHSSCVFRQNAGTVMRRKIDMLHGSLADKILLFALPVAATGILQQLFNAADVAVVGRYVGPDAMAAVGSNASLVGLCITLFIGISTGSNVVISHAVGQNDPGKISRAVHTSILTALIGGVMVAVLGQLYIIRLLGLLSVPEKILPMSTLYLRIYMCGLPLTFLYNFESSIFRSQGDTRTPLTVLSISGVINVVLNLFFVISEEDVLFPVSIKPTGNAAPVYKKNLLYENTIIVLE